MDGAFITIGYDPEFISNSSVFVFVETIYDDALNSSASIRSVHN